MIGRDRLVWGSASAYAIDAIDRTLRYLDVTLLNGALVEVNDDQQGWSALLDALPHHLDLTCPDLTAAIAALVPGGDAPRLATRRG